MEIPMNKRFLNRITDFIFIENQLQKADIIFVPGNGYPDMAVRAAELWHEGYAPFILVSGKYSKLDTGFKIKLQEDDRYFGSYQTECEFLSTVLRQEGVLDQAILKEDQATFTYENAIYARALTDQAGLQVHKAILCCQTYHACRCLMYFQLLYPDTQFYVCPADLGINRENWHQTEQGVELVLGEVERCGSQFHEIIKGCCN